MCVHRHKRKIHMHIHKFIAIASPAMANRWPTPPVFFFSLSSIDFEIFHLHFLRCFLFFFLNFYFFFLPLFFPFSCSVVERELNVPLPLSKIIKKWNNLLQEYKVSIFAFYGMPMLSTFSVLRGVFAWFGRRVAIERKSVGNGLRLWCCWSQHIPEQE